MPSPRSDMRKQMGYTHYWKRPTELPRDRFEAWATDVALLIENLPEHTDSAGGFYKENPLLVAWESDTPAKEPETTGDCVRFNGIGRDDVEQDDLGNETFLVTRVYEPYKNQHPRNNGLWGESCKTARKPYDLLVTAALIRFAYRFPGQVEISSDGTDDDWRAARDLCEHVFGHPAIVPLEKE